MIDPIIKKYLGDLGKKGWEARKKKYGDDFFKKIQQMGANARRKRDVDKPKPI